MNAFDYLAISIDGQLNMRAGPATASERMARLPDGTVLRRTGCLTRGEDGWCEVEFFDDAIEGWAAARFLIPWSSADPDALRSSTIQPDHRLLIGRSGRLSGRLEAGEILDVTFAVSADRLVSVALKAPQGIEGAIFASDGSLLSRSEEDNTMAVILSNGGEIVIRIADMTGVSGDWALEVHLE